MMNKLSFHLLLLQVCCLLFSCRHSRTQNLLNPSASDFPGPVPSGSAESCDSVYTRVAGLTCEGIQSSDPRILLQRCYVKAGDAHGVIAFYVNTTNLEEQQVFRVRITGPNILLPGILYCGHSAAYAQYNASTSGDYHAEILHLYENFSYSLPHPALKPQILLARHNFSIQAKHHLSAGHTQCGPALLADGRWEVSHKLWRAFHTTCVTEGRSFDACSEAVRTLSRDTDDTLLHWQPHLCPRLAREQDLDIRACLDKRRVCFSGDSQLRHAFNGFVALSEGGGRPHEYWQDWDFNKLIGKSAFSSYQFDAWAQTLATDNCSVIFVNVGQVRPSCHRLSAL